MGYCVGGVSDALIASRVLSRLAIPRRELEKFPICRLSGSVSRGGFTLRVVGMQLYPAGMLAGTLAMLGVFRIVCVAPIVFVIAPFIV